MSQQQRKKGESPRENWVPWLGHGVMVSPAELFCSWVSPSFPSPLLQEVGPSAGGSWTLQLARTSPSLHPSKGTAGSRNCSSTRNKAQLMQTSCFVKPLKEYFVKKVCQYCFVKKIKHKQNMLQTSSISCPERNYCTCWYGKDEEPASEEVWNFLGKGRIWFLKSVVPLI